MRSAASSHSLVFIRGTRRLISVPMRSCFPGSCRTVRFKGVGESLLPSQRIPLGREIHFGRVRKLSLLS